MLIWSIVPSQTIWETAEKESTVKRKIMDIKGAKVMVEPLADGRGRILQVLSTNPNDFLREELSPGAIVNLV